MNGDDRSAANRIPGDLTHDAANVQFRQIGKGLARTDAPGKVTGRTRYAGDLALPRMLHAKVLRSPVASARLRHIDASRARALAGVACVLTGADLPDRLAPTDIPGQTGQQRLKTDAQILVKDRVRYHGEPLALVAAESLAIAEQALELIDYELEPLPGVFDAEAALAPGAPIVQGTDNVVARQNIRKGDVERGLAEADVVVENTFRTQFVEHAYLEPEAGVAWVDENDVINLRVSTQVIEHFRDIADALGVPHNKVRVQGALIGGGFGGKEDITVEIYLALLAQATRRPVRLVYTREDSFFGHGKRHPFVMRYKVGAGKDGKITAMQISMVADAGAYVFLSPYVLIYAAVASAGPYRVDNLHMEGVAVATNNMYTSAFRGFGAAQACIAYEQQMDELATALGMDRLELRRRNFLRTGDLLSTGVPIESAVWSDECMTRAWEALEERTPDRGPVKVGRGVGCYQQSYGRLTWLHDTSEAWVGVEVDGTVVIRSGVTDIGAGQISALGQIAAELLGVNLTDVVIYNSDSAVTPLAGTTTATRACYMTGNAVRTAAAAVRERLLARAARELGVDAELIEMADSRVWLDGSPERFLTLGELAKICAAEGIPRSELAVYRAPFTERLDPETGQGRAHPDYTYGAHAVEVAVDTETGEITVLKSVGAHDVGQAINRAAVEGQIEGGTAQGQGYALSEEMIYRDGCLRTPSFSEYLIPTAMDVPSIQSVILESRSGLGPFGAKGIGEPCLTGVAPAIANAVADAIGVRIHELPITPERVVRALQAKADNAE
ncbi:MAG: xanthine dehydrogenase family protein [Gammaproteobacteria bacterium]|nr:xanthine dehydrogenase family protein [Gammaproteobacteria bacterium]NIR85594.1 xanthine dehydrogenase family protein [Gammaproteobacteria bacterium]NIR90035.1 xanthine dehydrogenase family protein [Gammaproteobacteria bacterium]NIU06723.1 xanthine dehydrogenase family protein [Gammaproteobacteria bacterium]NIV53654.1 molybdopterin-dependent oxidoreductase [Gammaproteobacteria bacterium]